MFYVLGERSVCGIFLPLLSFKSRYYARARARVWIRSEFDDSTLYTVDRSRETCVYLHDFPLTSISRNSLFFFQSAAKRRAARMREYTPTIEISIPVCATSLSRRASESRGERASSPSRVCYVSRDASLRVFVTLIARPRDHPRLFLTQSVSSLANARFFALFSLYFSAAASKPRRVKPKRKKRAINRGYYSYN